MTKGSVGRFFEDYTVGETIFHATPRTLTEGDVALYLALTGSRNSLHCADTFAASLGYAGAPIDDLLVFHTIFGKSVPDISLNAVANLGYAGLVFGEPVYPGDTLSAISDVVGLRENSNGKTGVVYVHTTGFNQNGDAVLAFFRWVMVNKRDHEVRSGMDVRPDLPEAVPSDVLSVSDELDFSTFDHTLSGSAYGYDDYAIGEVIDHVDGVTIDEAEHRMATRLYQNTARVHFNDHTEKAGRFGKCLVYGGHVISLARALSFNGLGNACRILAINAGSHTAPCFAGDTIYAWSEIIDKAEIAGRSDVGALRTRLLATRNMRLDSCPQADERGKYSTETVLSLDQWLLIPRSAG